MASSFFGASIFGSWVSSDPAEPDGKDASAEPEAGTSIFQSWLSSAPAEPATNCAPAEPAGKYPFGPCCSDWPHTSSGGGQITAAEGHVLLEKLQSIERQCRLNELAEGETEQILDRTDDPRQPKMWVHRTDCNPVVTVVLSCNLQLAGDLAKDTSLTEMAGCRGVDAVLQSLVCPVQRLSWDKESFLEYEVLRTCTTMDKPHEVQADIIYCAVDVPWPLWPREMLQRRLIVPLRGCNGSAGTADEGWAMICHSLEEDPATPDHSADRVRAFTHLSGYLVRPIDRGSVNLTALSQTDVGGIVPIWAQNLARRLAMERPVRWAAELEAHCLKRLASRASGNPEARDGNVRDMDNSSTETY